MDVRVIGAFSNAFFKSRFTSSLLNLHIKNVSQPAHSIPIIFLQLNDKYYNAIEPACAESIATSLFLTRFLRYSNLKNRAMTGFRPFLGFSEKSNIFYFFTLVQR